MNVDDWQKGNEAYLTHALAWLRLRLLRLAPPEQVLVRATAELVAVPRLRFWERPLVVPASTLRALPPPAVSHVEGSTSVSDAQLAQALAEMNAAESATPPPSLRMLSQALGLSRFEQELLLLCAAMELDTRIGSLCARAQDDPQRPYPTFALAFALFDNPSWDAISPEGPLRRWRLIEINQPGAQPLTTSPLRADERIVNYLKGLNYLDDRLGPLFVPFDITDLQAELPPSQQYVADQIVQRLHQAAPTQRLPVVQLLGHDPASAASRSKPAT